MTTLRINDAVRSEAIRVSESIGDGGRLALAARGGATVLPVGLAETMAELLAVLARGGTVTVAALPREITTTEAARQLGVSRPTVMKWIKEGALAARMVGTHHRLLSDDVVEFAKKRRAAQMRAFERLREADEDLGIDN